MNEKAKLTDLHGKQRQRLNAKACMSLFLSAVLLFTSIDYTQAQAQEVTSEVGTIQENSDSIVEDGQTAEEATESNEGAENADDIENPDNLTEDEKLGEEEPAGSDESEKKPEDTENSDNLDNPDNSDDSDGDGKTNEEETTENDDNLTGDEETNEEEITEDVETPIENEEITDEDETLQGSENKDEIQFVTTPDGAIIISGFEPLAETDSHIILEEKGTLAEVVLMMPSVLKAYAYIHIEETGTEGANTEENKAEETKIEETPDATVHEDTEGESSQETEEKSENQTALQELEIPVVSWECSEDYEHTELESYHFLPSWDSAAYSYETDGETNVIPMITVSLKKETVNVDGTVSTEKELAAALAAGKSKIVMGADISLTDTLMVPASADTVLDGQGFSLKRGSDEDGAFIGTMIYLGGKDYTEETYGTLSLSNICVDGQTSGDRAGSSAIIDYGRLILEEGAVIRNNKNYGTYKYDTDSGTEAVIKDFGGGIQVYGELQVTENALVTENFADEFGGGVYLADGATLYFHADVIKENSVSGDAGYGADLYAANGSTIYYDSSVDMDRDGFYLCGGTILICMQEQNEDSEEELELVELMSSMDDGTDRNDENVEVYISDAEGSGYSDEFLEALTYKLETEYKYSVIPKRAQVDTSDLRDWYVYDHYDTAETDECWGSEMVNDSYGNTVPQAWLKEYGNNPRRKYYPCTEVYYKKNGNLVYTIADWLGNANYKNTIGNDADGNPIEMYTLAQFKEHIYNPKGSTDMTFVGYGGNKASYGINDKQSYVDFMFYDPQSNGEKVVNYDIDSSRVITHALAGTGFLVNSGVKDGLLYGYLVLYYYGGSIPSLYIYKLEGVDVDQFHNGAWDLKIPADRNAIGTVKLERTYNSPFFSEWKNRMSIQIKVSSTKIEIWQKPYDGTTDFSGEDSAYECVDGLEDSGYSGFGPLAAYTGYGHNCTDASIFTYTNLRMYYTNPTQGNQDMLQPLELADYTQEGTQKYFLNLFGTSDQGYNNEGVEQDLYQGYLKLMQVEGVALITDRNTPFEPYLGKSGEAGSNLYEMISEGLLSVDELAAVIASYIEKQTTTYLQHKLQSEENDEGLKNADPKQAVGNIWLKSATGGGQVRTLWGDSFSETGYEIQIIDDIAYYYDGKDDYTVRYDVIKPNGSTYTFETKASDTAVPSFVVGTDPSEWSAGRYTVKQTIIGSYGDSTVHGYAYFDLKRNDVIEHTHSWSEWTIQKEPTCTETGIRTRECLAGCGTRDEEEIPATGHSPEVEWSNDEANHWHKCGICGEVFDVESHTWDEWSIQKEPTCTEPGIRIRTCVVGCGVIEEEKIPTIGHDFETAWRRSVTSHWHECVNCGIKSDEGEHEFGEWIIDKVATETEEGSRHRTCGVCRYTEHDPARLGEITKREDCGKDAPQTVISTELNTLAEAALEDEDMQMVGIGTDITIVLTVEDAGDTVSGEDKALVTSLMGSYKLGQYLDVNLYKDMDGGRFQITETSSEIRLILTVPAKLKNTKSKAHRDFVIIRVHGGNAVVLEDLDSDNNTITIDTDRFSTYAIVYGDENDKIGGSKTDDKSEPAGDNNADDQNNQTNDAETEVIMYEVKAGSEKDAEPRTGQTSHLNLYATIALIEGLSYLMVMFSGKHGMTEDRKNELVSRLIRWAKQGGKFRRALALSVIFLLLVYYHSIGKQITSEWTQIYS